MNISICLASYNGEKFIKHQIDSILNQIGEHDELLVVDDCSNDTTVEIVRSYQDSRIKILLNEINLGVVKSFEKAIMAAKNDIVYLCDQDDIWKENKVSMINSIFITDSSVTMVVSDAELIDGDGNSLNLCIYENGLDTSFLKNLISNNFVGCCMAFNKKIVTLAFPFPNKIPMHDSWLGLNHILFGKVYFLNKTLVGYRRHGANVTTGKRASLVKIVKWRFGLVFSLFIRMFNKG